MDKRLLILLGLAIVGSIAGFMVFNSNASSSFLKMVDIEGRYFPELEDLQARVIQYQEWQRKYNKQYSELEGHIRFKIWNQNYDLVQKHNSEGHTWDLEMNMFADLTDEEFVALHTGYMHDESVAMMEEENVEVPEDVGIPTSIDWRTKGAVTSVENQGTCGGCWAFSSAGALTGIYKIKKGTLINFSKQQQIDCSSSYGNQGCNGGLMVNAFRYTQAKGIERESDYPYQARVGTCRWTSTKVVFKNSAYTSVTRNSATALKNAVATRPVSVAVMAAASAFKLYRSGILSANCGTQLDHAILAVGYAVSGSGYYWIVKNSWGTSWGEQGYIRILAGTQNGGAGVCGINSSNSYPTLI